MQSEMPTLRDFVNQAIRRTVWPRMLLRNAQGNVVPAVRNGRDEGGQGDDDVLLAICFARVSGCNTEVFARAYDVSTAHEYVVDPLCVSHDNLSSHICAAASSWMSDSLAQLACATYEDSMALSHTIGYVRCIKAAVALVQIVEHECGSRTPRIAAMAARTGTWHILACLAIFRLSIFASVVRLSEKTIASARHEFGVLQATSSPDERLIVIRSQEAEQSLLHMVPDLCERFRLLTTTGGGKEKEHALMQILGSLESHLIGPMEI